MNFSLLKKLCAIHAPSGNESAMTLFLLKYIAAHSKSWNVKPELFYGDEFQDCIIMVFGKPVTAVYAHIDSIGFTARYDNELVKIGGPKIVPGTILSGEDKHGKIICELEVNEETKILRAKFDRTIEPGTDLS